MRRAFGEVEMTHGDQGEILLESVVPLPPVAGTLPSRLTYWSHEAPDRVWLSENGRALTYGEAEKRRSLLASKLLARQDLANEPLLFLAGNGINHALLMLAATSIGRTVAVVQPAYASAAGSPWSKLRRVLDQVDPALIVADDPATVARILNELEIDRPVMAMHDLAWLEASETAAGEALARAEKDVGPETVSKILFTSGSTGSPKGVPNTQRMMVSNMLGIEIVWPFLAASPPRLTDWLPWSHTFGGNCCFNIALWFGGTLHIDHGRPTPSLIDQTIASLREASPSIYFNVPIGYELLLPALEADHGFAASLLGGSDFLFNAGAAMPEAIRRRLETVALAATGRPARIVGGWGSTETAPFSTVLSFDTSHAGNLGTPMPGVTIKMVPDGGRYELRVRGPNVMPGYWRDADATSKAFDVDGFYRIGDAGKLVDPNDPSAGILFDGRVAENFKLSSGTFVNVGALRVAAVNAGEKLISDAVIAGEGRGELGVLVFPNVATCRSLVETDSCTALSDAAIVNHPVIVERIAALLRGHNAQQTGSSTRFARFTILAEPPSSAEDEITDKGYINQRRVLDRRRSIVSTMYEEGPTL